MNIGSKNHSPNPRAQCFPNFHGTLKKETINAITNRGGNSKDKTHHPDIPAILNRK